VPTRSQVATETITFNATPGDVMTNADPEAAQAGMDAWMAWSQRAGSAIVDLGSPLQAVSSDVEGDPVGGYSIMEADSLEALQDLLGSHPHTEWGGTIEIHEFLSMGGDKDAG
jgi:hypothetical protein